MGRATVGTGRTPSPTLPRFAGEVLGLDSLSRGAGEGWGGAAPFLKHITTTAFALTMLLATAASLSPARAQPVPGWKPLSAKDLAIKCHASEPGPHAACVAYVQAIFDLQFAPAPPRGICTPPDLTPELLAEVVTAYVDTHEDGPAPAAVGQAIVRFFPCTEQHR
jgi:hypothetical protein